MRPIFPMKYLNITQGHRGGTHKAGFPIDIAGKDTGIDDVFAPFDGMINKIYEPNNSALGHTVWLESLAPVTYADGTVDFATIMLTHDNAVTDLRVGQIVKQGQVFYQEGTAGFATGNHVHLEVARGKMAGIGWQQVNGSWIITNPYEPHKMFFIESSTIIINGGSFNWSIINNMEAQDIRNIGGEIWGRPVDEPTVKALTGRSWHANVYYLLGAYPWTNRKGAELITSNTLTVAQADIIKRDVRILQLQAELLQKPKEVPVEIIKEVPVEIIKEIRIPVEIDGLSVGELLSAIWAKLFKIK